jgi:hypothetical protein
MNYFDKLMQEEDEKRRNGGVLKDGEVLRVPVMMMDAGTVVRDAASQLESHQMSAFADALNSGQTLDAAVATAKAAKRVETFDAKHHQPGFHAVDQGAKEKRLADYDTKLTTAWKNPPVVLDTLADPHGLKKQEATMLNGVVAAAFSGPEPTRDQISDQYARRNQKLEQAWRNP